ncbi:MAG: hypothetical protein WA126_09825 [Thermodesulfovibrionales bacterium]
MAKGEICPKCGYYMFALGEEEGLEGSWILYECRDENCKYQRNYIIETTQDVPFLP